MVSERCVNTSEIQVLDFSALGTIWNFSELSVCNSVVYLRRRSEEEGRQEGKETGLLSQQPKQVKRSRCIAWNHCFSPKKQQLQPQTEPKPPSCDPDLTHPTYIILNI